MTSTVDIKDDSRGKAVHSAKIEIVLRKTTNVDELTVSVVAKDGGNGETEEQNAWSFSKITPEMVKICSLY
ncbi:hypothetical protein TanjilG_06784 [Lupinus angustifolius]|uniref:PLAT domain-containing protein n=1 Tax=Lupinus angustifolius TaxID=3871 RepID=A0A394DEL8_LUPAN|nr:hypothetical protein TanjilG_06784 [Lupinus angustifolius]